MNMPENTQVSETEEEEKISLLQSIFFTLKAVTAILLLASHTLFWFPWMMVTALLKLIVPLLWFRKLCTRVITFIAVTWISTNNFLIDLLLGVTINTRGLDQLTGRDWYLIISNHQSWVDILVLQKIFNRRIPFIKFFLKKELIWVPLLGPAWWALDFPFMKRYTRSFIEKNPHLKGKDIEITRKACRKFKYMPVSVMNFVEGTRFTKEKHDRQDSPFRYLLRPKAGGIGFVFTAMGEYLHSILNVTIIYPGERKDFWSFLCGRVREIDIIVEKIPVTEDLIGNYPEDPDYQEHFRKWLNDLWQKKDELIASEKAE